MTVYGARSEMSSAEAWAAPAYEIICDGKPVSVGRGIAVNDVYTKTSEKIIRSAGDLRFLSLKESHRCTNWPACHPGSETSALRGFQTLSNLGDRHLGAHLPVLEL